ncbi:FecCD family ABC transporter permease [Mangrovihabitans endophyticus]|uniref:Iron ABC transporter permease n=1 Tax=Mangrovihabitans endophyticus TaxID=1751298 RepID=A0A8J3FM69_9ACTN|nr:iron chelate uptake ABC transporter family permease subunit [Mangrovihabitans endophyticus]GGK77133.1 iron ABC transporter permease [Mangrovihabitans endophyticus]
MTRAAGLLAALLVLLAAAVASVALGARPVPLDHVWAALTAYDASPDAVAVRDLRLPRTLLGIAVGAALGVAGCLMQALTRNPLAEPGILGVNAGAAAAVVTATSLLGLTAPGAYVWFALAGAGASFALVYLLGSGGRAGASPARLAVAGTAVAAALTGYTSAIVLFDSSAFDRFRFWAVGALADRGAGALAAIGPFLAAGLLIAATLGPGLNAVALGDDQGRALGARPALIRGGAAAAAVPLSAGGTAAAGPIGFVGLAVPHAARAFTGPDERWVMAYSALLAPALLLTADVAGRLLGRPGELETGVVTALVGAPLFIVIVRRMRVARL